MSIEITEADFDLRVLNPNVPVLVDVWAPWCGPCKMLGPIILALSEEVGEEAKVFKINADENPGVLATYGVTALPTVLIFEGGKATKTLVGLQPKPRYLEALGL